MENKKMDYSLLLVTLMLVGFGLLMVFSSSYYYAIDKFDDKMHFFNSELKWIIVGIVAMMVASRVNYKVYKKIAVPFYIVSVILLVYVLVNGTTFNEAQRWISIGKQTFQPAEISKIATVFFFAYYLDKHYDKMNKLKHLLPLLGLIALNAGLIMKQPNMSTAVILTGISMIMLFVGGLYWRYVLVTIGGGGVLGYTLIKMADYRMDRWTAFLNPFAFSDDESYQVVQGLYALGTGGPFGVGLGMSTQNKLYIPEPQNDFILATIGEEFGFIGMIILLVLFLILVYRCVKIAFNAPDKFSMFVATGISSQLALQVLMNFAVVTSSMPATGISLPFISYGGTSIAVLLASMGVMLNISKQGIRRTRSGE